jgi:hypothetical protein
VSNPRIVLNPREGLTPEQARDARARAWAYVFDCFNRRREQEGGAAISATDDAAMVRNTEEGESCRAATR